MANLLIVDDEVHVLNALRRMFLNATAPPALPDLHLTTFTAPIEALEHVINHQVDLVISDYRMPVMDGVSFLTRVKELQPDTARIILSACTDMEGIVRAINEAGIFRFVSKPWSDPDFKTLVSQVLAHRELLVENRRLADEVRCQRGVISRQQLELARLESESPGITRVRWTEDGGVLLEE
ncbi:MAG TPA: response regulator [Casimicrobiaceae bacterium]|jgi:response regulator RpfG family c-di-GMP phosphodiesterase